MMHGEGTSRAWWVGGRMEGYVTSWSAGVHFPSRLDRKDSCLGA